jgi:FHS family glucose/mannose:H+ symporter-like MFS transporter
MGETRTIKTPGPVKAFYPMMIVPGIVLLLAPATVENIMSYFHFRESLGGLLQVFAGGVIGILAITRLIQRFSVRDIAVANVLILSGSLLAASFSPWYWLLLTLNVITGVANGILIAFPGVYVTRTCGQTSHREQNILYAFFSLGVVTGPILAIIAIPLSIPLLFAAFERLDGIKPISRDSVREILAFNRRLFYGLLVALVLYIAAESAVSLWLVTFFHEHYGMEIGNAHWILTGLWIGITVGRVICGYLAERIDPFRILVFVTLSAGICLLVAPLASSKYVSMALYPVVGLFYAGIYPFLIGYAARFPTSVSSTVFTLYIAAGAAGGAVLPYLIGLVNQFTGLIVGMCLVSVPLFGVLACLYWLRPEVSSRAAAGIAAAPDA